MFLYHKWKLELNMTIIIIMPTSSPKMQKVYLSFKCLWTHNTQSCQNEMPAYSQILGNVSAGKKLNQGLICILTKRNNSCPHTYREHREAFLADCTPAWNLLEKLSQEVINKRCNLPTCGLHRWREVFSQQTLRKWIGTHVLQTRALHNKPLLLICNQCKDEVGIFFLLARGNSAASQV